MGVGNWTRVLWKRSKEQSFGRRPRASAKRLTEMVRLAKMAGLHREGQRGAELPSPVLEKFRVGAGFVSHVCNC